MPKLYRWDKQLAALLMLSFFLPAQAQTISLIALSAFFAIRDMLTFGLPGARHMLRAFIPGGIYLLYLGWLPFTGYAFQPELRIQLENKASLLFLPIALACMQQRTLSTIVRQLHWFAIGCIASCLTGNLSYIAASFPFSDPETLNHVHYRLHFEDLTGIHPSYMGLYICFAGIILLCHQQHYGMGRVWLGLVLLLLFFFLFSLFPKTALIAMVLLLFGYIVLHRRDYNRWLTALVAFAGASAVGLALPFGSRRVAELKSLLPAGGTEGPVANSVVARELIWQTDLKMFRQYWLSGIGPGRLHDALMNHYFALSAMSGYPLPYYDTHNEYMNVWISFGILGILVFVLTLLIQLLHAFRLRDWLGLALLAALCICFTTENILNNQRGVIFYAFFAALAFLSATGLRYGAPPAAAQESVHK